MVGADMRLKFVILAIFVTVLLVVTMPLRLALSLVQADRWFYAARVDGTIWNGVLHAGHLGRLSLGDARLALNVPALLSGRVGFGFSAAGALKGSGIAVLSGNGHALRANALRFPISALSPSLPLEGEMRLSGIDVAFRDGACHAAQGSVMVKKVRLSHGSMLLAPDFQLRGALGCAGGDVIMRLAGRSGDIALRSVIRISATGAYRMENRIQGTGQCGDAMAAEAGFQREVDGYARVDRGNLAL